jgi:hypothetical protein
MSVAVVVMGIPDLASVPEHEPVREEIHAVDGTGAGVYGVVVPAVGTGVLVGGG